MLSLANRNDYHTLLDALVLNGEDDSKPAIIYLETEQEPIIVSRAQFREMTLRYASALSEQGIQARDLVIIAYTQNLASIYAFWGAMWLGAIPSMFPTLTEKLDPEIYAQNMAELVRFSNVKAILTTDEFAPQIAAMVDCTVLSSSDIEPDGEIEPYQASPDSIAFLQHSSGTTGLQKGVALSHQAVLNQLASYSNNLSLLTDDVVVSWLPLYHDMGLIAGFLLPLIQGIPLVLMSPFDWVAHPAMLLRAISDYRGTLCWLPNFAYNHMTRRIRVRDVEGVSLTSMRAFINCSEPVRYDSHQQFLERFADCGLKEEMLTVSYAMAENTFAVTQTPIGQTPTIDRVNRQALEEQKIAQPENDSQSLTMVSCGKPIKNTQVRVIDADGQELAERHVGELIVQSDCMLTEYYKRPDLEPFVVGWYKTGDMGYIADGEIYVIGRQKDLIINAGKNVYPQDVEAIVNTVEGVKSGRCVVFGVPSEREGTEVIAVVAEMEDFSLDQQTLKKQIRQQVVRQSTVSVSFITLVDAKWLIKTSSGKIARSANREKWLHEKSQN